MVPQKDLAVYGYGSVAWKDRMEDWKKKQNEKLQVVRHEGDPDFEDGDDIPMYRHNTHKVFCVYVSVIFMKAFFLLYFIGWMREGSHCLGRYQSNQARSIHTGC